MTIRNQTTFFGANLVFAPSVRGEHKVRYGLTPFDCELV